MGKQQEIEYLDRIGEAAVSHARDKPYSDPECGRYLMEVGLLLSMLPPPPARLLDLSCGSGWTSCLFARRGYQVVGQDIAPRMIACAEHNKQRAGLQNLEFVVSDYEGMCFDEPFDCAVFYDSLHHAVCEKAALRAVYLALREGGVCVAAEPGVGHARSRSSLEHIRQYGVTEKDMPPGRIIRAAREAGFRSFAIYPHLRHLRVFAYPERRGGFWRRTFFQNPLLRSLGQVFVSTIYKHFNGIVLMVK